MAFNNNNNNVVPPPLLPHPPHPAGAPPPVRGGGRGNRRRGNQNRRAPVDRPQRDGGALPPPGGPPRPQRLQTEATPDRNDPLWSPGFTGAELQPLPNVEYVYSGFEALPQVISVLHASYTAASASYSRRITESMLGYYCACASWYRALSLQQSNSLRLSGDEESFIDQFSSLQLEAPMLLAHYLSGFGNTRVPSGRDIRFRMPDRPAYLSTDFTNGWFGAVSAETQKWYSQYPCLAVYASRLMNETSAGQYYRNWYLPGEVLPVMNGGTGPTLALLGYGNRTRLSRTQIAFLEGLGIFDNAPFPSANGTFALHVDLLLAIQNELGQATRLKLSRLPTGILGSQAQLARLVMEEEFAPVVERSMTLQCPYRLPSELSFPASAFAYRVVHDLEGLPDNTVAPWCIWGYRLDNAEHWEEMVAQGNALRLNEPEFLSLTEFRTTPYLLRARLEALERSLAVV